MSASFRVDVPKPKDGFERRFEWPWRPRDDGPEYFGPGDRYISSLKRCDSVKRALPMVFVWGQDRTCLPMLGTS